MAGGCRARVPRPARGPGTVNGVLGLIGQLRADLELPLGLVLSVAITLHVLRTKEDVTAAIGWIGLGWFAPFIGGFAYIVLGINRVQRRARRLRGGPPRSRHGHHDRRSEEADQHLEPLRRGVTFITARQIEPGCLVRVLYDGDEAYPPMLEAIAAAQCSIGLSSYIFRADTIGRRFVQALAEAQARGVQVRVMVDGIGSGWWRSPAYDALVAAGLPARRFLHSRLPWKMPFLNLRMHSKIMVVDGRVGFTGGCNIADQNILADTPKDPVQDTHFCIEGPVVGQLSEIFIRDWLFCAGEALDGEAWLPSLDRDGDVEARVVTAGPDQDLEKIEFTVLQAIACARESIQVMTPYFLPDHQLLTALSLAAARGVAVDVVVPERSDQRMVDWAMEANCPPLLQDGVRIWYSPQPFRHSKVTVVDGEWSLIGSSNWDTRSFRLNFETCVELYDAPLATELGAHMVACRGRPMLRSGLLARPAACRLRNAAIRLLLPYL